MRIADYMRRVAARRNGTDPSPDAREPRTAFVLSGGGVLGAVQVGQLTALLERNIRPDLIVATSVGALNGAMVAAKPTTEGTEILAGIWASLRTEDIFPGSRVSRVWHAFAGSTHLFPNDGLRRLVERLPIRTFEEATVPLHVCATNLRTGNEHWFSEGSVESAILASSALPGVFPPVAVNGETYIDGGVVNNVPVSRAVELGARRVYVLTCAAPERRDARPIRRPLDVLVQAFAHSRATRMALDAERFAGRVDIVAMPTFDPGFIRYDDPSHSGRLMTRALELSREFLERADALEA